MSLPKSWTILFALTVLGCTDRPTATEGSGEGTSGPDDGTGADGASGAADESTGAGACEWNPAPVPEQIDEPPAPECESFVSTAEVSPVTVRITNDSDEVVRLAGPINCKDARFGVVDANTLAFPDFDCLPTCEATLSQECGCLADCPFPPTIALFPGRSYEVEWPGFVLEVLDASPECAGECAIECGLRVEPAPGPMRVMVATADEIIDCGEPCECDPGEQGWCELPGYPETVEVVERMIEWPPACPTIDVSVP